MDASFKKEERLTHKKWIDELFESGKVIKKYPLLGVWKKVEHPLEYPLQVGVSVPKRKFKKAVERNLLKRRIKEAYRLKKAEVYEEIEGNFLLMLVYVAKEEKQFAEIQKAAYSICEELILLNSSKSAQSKAP